MEDLVFSSSELDELEEIDKQAAEQLNGHEENAVENIEIENPVPEQNGGENNQIDFQEGNEHENQGEYQEEIYQEQYNQEEIVQQPEQECLAMPYQKPPENVPVFSFIELFYQNSN